MLCLILVRWEWSRDPHSLSAGTLIGNSSGPRLLITDLLPGSYIFQLQVSNPNNQRGARAFIFVAFLLFTLATTFTESSEGDVPPFLGRLLAPCFFLCFFDDWFFVVQVEPLEEHLVLVVFCCLLVHSSCVLL